MVKMLNVTPAKDKERKDFINHQETHEMQDYFRKIFLEHQDCNIKNVYNYSAVMDTSA